MPKEVTFTNGNSIKFFYSAEGENLRTVYTISGAISQKDYCGNIVYESGVQKYLLNDEGYYDLASGGYHYYLKEPTAYTDSEKRPAHFNAGLETDKN